MSEIYPPHQNNQTKADHIDRSIVPHEGPKLNIGSKGNHANMTLNEAVCLSFMNDSSVHPDEYLGFRFRAVALTIIDKGQSVGRYPTLVRRLGG